MFLVEEELGLVAQVRRIRDRSSSSHIYQESSSSLEQLACFVGYEMVDFWMVKEQLYHLRQQQIMIKTKRRNAKAEKPAMSPILAFSSFKETFLTAFTDCYLLNLQA